MPKKQDSITSIFQKYYTDTPFYDRFARDPKDAVDVIIPIIHTNELWEVNLKSLYREIPINRLLIGDGGCIDDSIKIAKKFPRVKVIDHKKYKSLGYSIRKLIEEVETEWFIYPHSDVYLPPGWFNRMKSHQSEYDWFGCPMRMTVMAEYDLVDKIRPYAGSQMGRKAAFEEGLEKIDDDYVYRQEDFVFASLIEKGGFKHGKIEDTFHYHQVMHKKSPFGRKINSVSLNMDIEEHEKVRSAETQAKGVVKYLEPNQFQQACVNDNLLYLMENKKVDLHEFREWAKKVNPDWLKYIKPEKIILKVFWRNTKLKIKKTIINITRSRR